MHLLGLLDRRDVEIHDDRLGIARLPAGRNE
jgi:hypothetical protein